MELKEDLIIIEAEKAKDKLYNLKAEIEKADGNLKAFLCDLFDIYMFQVFFGGMPRSTEESNTIPEGEDEMIHSDLTKKEWDELSEWRKGIDVKFEESLTEGSSWSEQVDKMKALEAGTRGFNAKAASDSKLRMNQQICVSHNLPLALSIVETEMLARGLISKRTTLTPVQRPAPAPTPVVSAYDKAIHLEPMDFHTADAQFVKDAKDTSEVINNCASLTDQRDDGLKMLLVSLVWALCLQKPSGFIQALKIYLTDFCEYSNDLIKETIKECLNNPEIITRLNQTTQEIK